MVLFGNSKINYYIKVTKVLNNYNKQKYEQNKQ